MQGEIVPGRYLCVDIINAAYTSYKQLRKHRLLRCARNDNPETGVNLKQ